MDTENINNEIIERYLRGEMTPEEEARFEKELGEDQQLRSQFETMRHITEAFAKKGEQKALEQLMAIGSEKELYRATGMRKKPSGRRSFIGRHIGSVALIAACVGIGLMLFGYMPRYSSTYLYNQSVTYPAYWSAHSRGGEEVEEELAWMVELASGLYDEKDYGGAALVYDKIYEEYPRDEIPDDVIYYSGLSYLFSGNYDLAIEMLAYALETDSDFMWDAQWYLALSHLAKGEKLATREILESITTNDESPYAERAVKLIVQIKTKRWF